MMKTMAFMILTIALLSCSESPSETEHIDNKADNKHMLSDQEKMLQKAKDTEKLIHEADEKRRKALEDQGG
ncbi:MAG: hypothetical protein DWP95_12355 [Proteobacteria bacterium]|nr:MAG: hypothetical protein DWP95_12355 [Pseudomonadota bacterium]